MENLLLIPPVDEVDVVLEVELFKRELSNLDDESLIDEILQLIPTFTFMKKTEQSINYYMQNGQLPAYHREVLEGCYILAHSIYMMSENESGAIIIQYEDDF